MLCGLEKYEKLCPRLYLFQNASSCPIRHFCASSIGRESHLVTRACVRGLEQVRIQLIIRFNIKGRFIYVTRAQLEGLERKGSIQ